jgi:hypothetical protein
MVTVTSTDWTVHLETAGSVHGAVGEDALDELLVLLREHGGSVTSTTDGSSYGATFSMRGYHAAVFAAERGVHIFRAAAGKAGLPDLPIVRVETLTFEEHDAEPVNPPEVVGVSEIATLIGVTRQRASALARSVGFPAPIAVLRSGPIWTRPSLNHFLESWPRKGGRPPASVDRPPDEEHDVGMAVG